MGKDGSVMVERLVKKTSFSRSFPLRSTDGKCCLSVDFYLCFYCVDFILNQDRGAETGVIVQRYNEM